MTLHDKKRPKWPLFAWWQNLSKSRETVETTGIQPEGKSGEPSITPGPWGNVASTLVELLRLSENAAAKILALEKSVGEIPKQGHFELLRGEWESSTKNCQQKRKPSINYLNRTKRWRGNSCWRLRTRSERTIGASKRMDRTWFGAGDDRPQRL